jgi:DNA-binding GntR family transcriptional regulator
LPKGLLADFGVSRDAKSRALRELEAASLVRVKQVRGRAALVCLHLEDQPISAVRLP